MCTTRNGGTTSSSCGFSVTSNTKQLVIRYFGTYRSEVQLYFAEVLSVVTERSEKYQKSDCCCVRIVIIFDHNANNEVIIKYSMTFSSFNI